MKVSADRRVRYCLLGLATLSNIGIALELGFTRHWGTRTQLIPWAMVVVTVGAIVVVVTGNGRWRTHVARAVSALVAVGAAFGVYEHVRSNYQTAPLQTRFADRWSTMSTVSKIWEAATGGVRNSSPPLAPSAMVVAAALIWIATMRSWGAVAATAAAPFDESEAEPSDAELATW